MENTEMKIERTPPVRLPGKIERSELRDGWPVALAYAGEGEGPWLIDLSHFRRWDLQGSDPARMLPPGLAAPDAPGGVFFSGGTLVSRSGMRQLSVWLLAPGGDGPSGTGCTETGEGTLCIALLGRNVFSIAEKLTPLDLADPKRIPPYLIQGPFSHVTCQIVVLRKGPAEGLVLLTCARGYGEDLVRAVLTAGEEFGLRPGGEDRISGRFTV